MCILFIVNFILLYLFTSFSSAGETDHLLVVTTAKNSLRETVQIGAEIVAVEDNLHSMRLGNYQLPGNNITRLMSFPNQSNKSIAVFTTRKPKQQKYVSNDGIYLCLLDSEGYLRRIQFLQSSPEWEVKYVDIYVDKKTDQFNVLIIEGKDTQLGRALVYPLSEKDTVITPQTVIPLPFNPQVICPLPEQDIVFIGRTDELDSDVQCSLVDIKIPLSRVINLELPNDFSSITDVFTIGHDFLGILTSNWTTEDYGESQSNLLSLDNRSWTVQGTPLSLYGEGKITERNVFPTHYGFWIKTSSLEDGFGYLTLVNWDPIEGWRKELEYSFTNIDPSWIVAVNENYPLCGVASGYRLEIMGKNVATPTIFKFTEPITSIEWVFSERVLVASGGRTWLVNISNKTCQEWLVIQSGWIYQTVALPSATRSSFHQDEIVTELFFDGDYTGQETRKIMLPKLSKSYEPSWQITKVYPSSPIPWLEYRLEPTETTDLLSVSTVSPPRYAGYDFAWFTVEPYVLPEERSPISMPRYHYVHVRLYPKRRQEDQVLWIWAQPASVPFQDESDPRELKRFGDMLAQSPFALKHVETTEPVFDLYPWGIVCIEAQAIAMGLITPSEIVEYLQDGGRILILGDYWIGADSEIFNFWLNQFGIEYHPEFRVDGVFPIDAEESLLKYWKDFPIYGGGLLFSVKHQSPLNKSVGDEAIIRKEQVAFLTRKVGKGKFAFLSSKTPLNSKNLAHTEQSNFATELILWMNTPETAWGDDYDGDQIPNIVEDLNMNNQADINETHLFDSDTDKDGIPDGDEDLNRNGLWEENETDPICNDSDGDGIFDPADVTPVPLYGQPVITQIMPAESPAEGGSLVLIRGRHFRPNTAIWFSTRQSPYVNILSPYLALAIVPDSFLPQGGKVLVSASEKRPETITGKPFLYTARNTVRIQVTPVNEMNEANPTQYILRIQIQTPPTNTLKTVHILLNLHDQPLPQVRQHLTSTKPLVTTAIKPLVQNWYLLTLTWERLRNIQRNYALDLVFEQIKSDSPLPEITKAWALTAFGGRFITILEK